MYEALPPSGSQPLFKNTPVDIPFRKPEIKFWGVCLVALGRESRISFV
jgi:hypothetical protein